MLASMLLKKIIFFFSTGTLLFYLISFNSNGQPNYSAQEKAAFACQESVRNMNYNHMNQLRRGALITHENVLLLTFPEQRALNSYLKEMKVEIVKGGKPNPLRMTTYVYESANRKNLGYKIVVDTVNESHDVATYFVGKEGNILFTHRAGIMASQRWNCEASVNVSNKLF